jgi:hypothetical protein
MKGPLRAAALDAAYGFSAKQDLLAQLLALNFEVAANIEKSSPVTAPVARMTQGRRVAAFGLGGMEACGASPAQLDE